jgi:hypothetical protein
VPQHRSAFAPGLARPAYQCFLVLSPSIIAI